MAAAATSSAARVDVRRNFAERELGRDDSREPAADAASVGRAADVAFLLRRDHWHRQHCAIVASRPAWPGVARVKPSAR